MLFCLLVNSYNKLEEDFQTATDPLKAYNDYLEEVETISMNIMVTEACFLSGWHAQAVQPSQFCLKIPNPDQYAIGMEKKSRF